MNHQNEIRAAKRMLGELYSLAEEATLTGGLSGGRATAIQRYNQTIARLEAIEALPAGMYTPLSLDADYGTLAVEARLASGYLEESANSPDSEASANLILRLAPFVDSSDLMGLIRESQGSGTALSADLVSKIAPFLDRGAVGELLRQSMQRPPTAPTPEEPPTPPVEPVPPAPPAPTAPPVEAIQTPEPAPTPEGIARLVSRLTSSRLTAEEREDILQEINRMTSPG